MLLKLFFLLSITIYANAFQVPVVSMQMAPNQDTQYLSFFLNIGTPSQPVVTAIHASGATLIVSDERGLPNDQGFNPDLSTTFVDAGNLNAKLLNGTDVVTFDDGTTLPNKPFLISNSFAIGQNIYGLLGITRNMSLYGQCNEDQCTSFLQSVLQNYEHQFLTLSFDHLSSDLNDVATGKLTIGEDPKALCSSNLHVFNEVEYVDTVVGRVHSDWVIQSERATFGKSTFFFPKIFIQPVRSNTVRLSSNIAKVVRSVIGRAQFGVPCDTKLEITFHLPAGQKILLTPDMYLLRSDKWCMLFENPSEVTQIPLNLLDPKCLYYDYENKQVGLSTRIEE